MHNLIRSGLRLAVLGLAVTTTVGGNCDSRGPVSAGEVTSGTVTGQVTVDGVGRTGVSVILRTGTTTIATTQTGSGGTYTFANVVTEAKTVAITPPSGTTCDPTQRDVTVSEGGTATANFACTTPPLQTGTVTGTVIVDGAGMSGVNVMLWDVRRRVIAMTTTGQVGTYQFSNVVVGVLAVSIESILRSGASCPTTQLNVTVPAGGTGTANFDCLGPRGTVTGKVTLDGAAAPGVALSLHDGTTLIATTTTDQAGIYEFSAVTLGTRILSIAKPTGTACTWSQLNIPVRAMTIHHVDFACRTLPPPSPTPPSPPPPSPSPEMPSPEPRPPAPPLPSTGTVYGRVTLNGGGVPDVVVTLNKWSYGITELARTRTRGDGSYAFEDVPRGEYLIRIEPPPGWEGCSTATQVALLTGYWGPEGNFVCPRPG